MNNPYIIKDWADNLIKLPNCPEIFFNFDDAEEALAEFLGGDYERDRGEYFILPISFLLKRTNNA